MAVYLRSTSPIPYFTDWMALLRTQFWNCCVSDQLPLVKASLVQRHSPLNIDARIYEEGKVSPC
jgi:hypothetical protein